MATSTTLHLLNLHSNPKTPSSKLPRPTSQPQPNSLKQTSTSIFSNVSLAASTALALPLIGPQDALAAGGEFGILEGRSVALIHPIVMGGLFVYTLYAGYLGWQWRRVRTIQDEINELKKQVKPPAPAAVRAGADVAKEAPPAPPSPVEQKIQQLTEERKALLKGSFRDRHFNAGSILLAFGVLEAVGGGVNTYMRAGKLFPGPHLFAGAGTSLYPENLLQFSTYFFPNIHSSGKSRMLILPPLHPYPFASRSQHIEAYLLLNNMLNAVIEFINVVNVELTM